MDDIKDKLQIVFNHFIPGDQISITKITGGLIHVTYKVTRNNESYLLQKLNTLVFPKPEVVLSNIVKITTHLAKKPDYPYQVVSPYKLIKGEGYLYRDETGAFWRLFPYLNGSVTYENTSDTELVFKAAYAFASFTSFLTEFNIMNLHPTIPHFHDPPHRWRQFEKAILKAIPHRKDGAAILIRDLEINKSIFREFASLKLPTRIVHNDAKLNNILFKRNSKEALAIIDMDTVMPGTVLYDFGDMVRTMATSFSEEHAQPHDISIQKDLFQTIWVGYCHGLRDQLTPFERGNLFLGAAYIILEQSVRFMVDYLTGDKYYHVDYPDHNLNRAKNQFALFKSLVSRKDYLCTGLMK